MVCSCQCLEQVDLNYSCDFSFLFFFFFVFLTIALLYCSNAVGQCGLVNSKGILCDVFAATFR